MITDNLIRNKFIHETVKRGINKIYSIQEQVVRDNYELRTGRLIASLSSHTFSASEQGFTRVFLSEFFLISAFSIWLTGYATTESQSIGVPTLLSIIGLSEAFFIMRCSPNFPMALRTK